MLDYILFHKKPFQLFVDWLKDKAVPVETSVSHENYEIQIPEDIDESLLDEIELVYDDFMEMNQQIVEQEEKLKWMITAAQAKIEVWRTEQANSRYIDKAHT